MVLANIFRRHIGQFDIMLYDQKITLQVYKISNMLILIDENEKSNTVYDIFTYDNLLRYWRINQSLYYEIDSIELKIWKKPTPDQWILIKQLKRQGVNVKFVAKPKKIKGGE